MVVAYFYSGGPRPIAATPLGEVFAGGFLGLLLVTLSAYVQAREAPPDALLVGLPSALIIADILTVNNTCDIRGDAAAGRTTLSILLGERQSHALISSLVAGAYLLAFALAALRVLPMVTIAPLAAGAAFAGRTLRRMHRDGYAHRTKPRAMAGISRIFLAYTGAVLAGLLLEGVRAAVSP